MARKSVFIYPFNLSFSSDAHLAPLLKILLIILSVNSHLAKCRKNVLDVRLSPFLLLS